MLYNSLKTVKVPTVTEWRAQNFEWPFDSLEEAKESLDNILDAMKKNIPCTEQEAIKFYLAEEEKSPQTLSLF